MHAQFESMHEAALDRQLQDAGVGFTAYGLVVLDPFLDESGTVPVDPRTHYGMDETDMGGGIVAWTLTDEDGREVRLMNPTHDGPPGCPHDWVMLGIADDPPDTVLWSLRRSPDGRVTVHICRDTPPPPSSTHNGYSLLIDGTIETTLAEFLSLNDGLSPDDIARLRAMDVGSVETFGGGAFATYTVERVRRHDRVERPTQA